MREEVTGIPCLACGAPVQFYEFTSLCDDCEDANLRYAHEQRRFPGPLLPQWESVVNILSFAWSCMEEEMWERYCHEADMIRNAMRGNTFNRPPRFPEEH